MEFTAQLSEKYLAYWNLMRIRPDKISVCKTAANKVAMYRSKYEKVANEFGCPWWWVGIIHSLEGNCNFGTWLANGDPIGKPTTHVPAGLKCDGTWEDGARVSLKNHGMPKTEWTLARCLYEWTRYNGFGYDNRGKPSQYVWSFTNIEQPGRYVQDGVWNDTVMSGQVGCAAMLRALIDAGHVSFETNKPQASADERANWLEIYRIEEGGNVSTGCVAWEDNKVIATWDGRNKRAFFDFTNRFVNASAILTAPGNKAWPTSTHTTVPPQKEKAWMKLVRTHVKEEKGCERLLLTMEGGTGEHWYVRSGQPNERQVFQQMSSDNVPGSMFPLPAGEYKIEDIRWAVKDDYTKSLGTGLGPLFVPVIPLGKTKRSDFGLHLDANVYGTAGCVGLTSIEDVKKLVVALRKYDPKRLVVDWS